MDVRFVSPTLLLVVASFFSSGCVNAPPEAIAALSPSPSARPTEPIAAQSRTACATRVLTALVNAINSRDAVTLGQMIGSGPLPTQAFQWVSMTSAANTTVYNPDDARSMLLQRAAQGERWTLGVVVASDGPSWHGGIDAEVHFERQLADGRVVKTSGKTALSCIGSAIYVLSLGDE
jgi:hypothetical protein